MPECKNDNDPCDVLPKAGEVWNLCLPWGGRLWYDGYEVHAVGGIAPPDGVYDRIVIADGCIIGVEHGDVPIYQGAPCAGLPGDCGAASAAAAAAFASVAAPVAESAAVMLASVSIKEGANVNICGAGTEQDPYIISADTGVYIRSENFAIAVTGQGTRSDPINLKHKSGYAGTINGMTFDAFGHLIDAIERPAAGNNGVVGIVPEYGIKVTPDPATGIVKIGVQPPPNSVKGTAQLGAYDTDIDEIGRITAIKRTIELPAATLVCGATDIGVSPTGSITDFNETSDTGASYLCLWEKPTQALPRRGAKFHLRVSTQLAGLCVTDAEVNDLAFFLDGQPCGNIGCVFWGSGIYLAGEHTLEVVPAPDAAMVIILKATALADETW